MSRFRLMSANLFNRFVKIEHLTEVIDRVAPDILIVVEMPPDAAPVIADRYPHHVLHIDQGFFGWGIASRLPAHLDQEVQPWRGGRGRVEVGDRMVNLAAAHITDPLFGNWRALSRERRIQVDALFEWADGLPDGEPVLIAGDMNASPMWKVYRRLAGRFDDLVAEAAAATGHRPGRTWGPGPNLLRIDHVFGRGLRGVETRVEKIRGSDHAAVVVDLELQRAGLSVD